MRISPWSVGRRARLGQRAWLALSRPARTAAHNLRRAGVAEGVILKIEPGKLGAYPICYAIISQSDIRHAMTKLDASSALMGKRSKNRMKV